MAASARYFSIPYLKGNHLFARLLSNRWEEVNATRMMTATVVLLMVGAYLQLPMKVVRMPDDLSSFPRVLGSWQGGPLSLEPFSSLGADSTLARRYSTHDEQPIDLYVAYFSSQAQARELAGDRTERFLLGDNPLEDGRATYHGLEVRRIVQRQGNAYQLVFCWYELDGQSGASPLWVVLQTIKNGVLHHRSNGAIVALAVQYERPEQLQGQAERLGAFIQDALPSIKRRLTTI
jgi:EpsI family protein